MAQSAIRSQNVAVDPENGGTQFRSSPAFCPNRYTKQGTTEKCYTIINMNPRSPNRPTASQGGSGMLTSGTEVFCLQTTPHYVMEQIVSDSARSTATPKPSIDTTDRNTEIMEMQPKLFATNCP